MSSISHFLILLSLLSFAPFCQAKVFNWNKVTHEGAVFIPLKQIKEFYGFSSLEVVDRKITLSNKDLKLVFHSGSQEIDMNGVKIFLRTPAILIDEEHCISQLDTTKIIDPILRPAFIKDARPFDTVIIDAGFLGAETVASSLNLKIADLLKQRLTKQGFKVIMTRNSDRKVSKKSQVQIANKYRNAIFIKIHLNGMKLEEHQLIKGIQTSPISPKYSSSMALSTAAHWGTRRLFQREMKLDLPDLGIRDSQKDTLPELKHPAVMINIGYRDDPAGIKMVNQTKFLSTTANGLSHAISFYRKSTIGKKKKK